MRYYSPPPPSAHKLFISHAWDYSEEYDALVNLLTPDISFTWEDFSVPQDQPLFINGPLQKSFRYIVRQLDDRIYKADCVLVLAGMYANHKGWIQSEIEAAKEFGKPIIAVVPRGSERLPIAVTHAADKEVLWNRASIIEAIEQLTYPHPAAISYLPR